MYVNFNNVFYSLKHMVYAFCSNYNILLIIVKVLFLLLLLQKYYYTLGFGSLFNKNSTV